MTTVDGTSDLFANGDGADLQAARPWPKGYFLSDRVRGAKIDGIRGLLTREGPGIISFCSDPPLSQTLTPSSCRTANPLHVEALLKGTSAGKPNPMTFPFSSISVNLKAPLGDRLSSSQPGLLPVPETVTIQGPDLEVALQYGATTNLPTVKGWLEGLQEKVHGRKIGEDWALTMANGSQDAMFKTFGAVLNPGDPVLLETPLYAGVLPPLRLLNAEPIEVNIDDNGLSAEHLEHILATWPEDKMRPKVVYTCPTGGNPSGCSSSKERKLAVLKIAKKYGLLIMEDDPYYYLAENVLPSYFALETQVFPEGGHVVRFDSFSKLLAAGMRLGYATGPPDIIHALNIATSGAQLHSSFISQAVAYALLSSWGQEGFLAHSVAVARFYAERRAKFETLAHKYLDGLATWVSPVAGMFLWLDLSPAGITDSAELISEDAFRAGVLCTPGFAFFPKPQVSHYTRLSFSLIDLDHDAETGFIRLRGAIQEKQKQLGIITNGAT